MNSLPPTIQEQSKRSNESHPIPSKGTVAEFLVDCLTKMNVRVAFGVSGGNIVPIWEALEYSEIDTLHFRHETGAVFAACEYSIATREPVAVFVTGGPGIANSINGLLASKWEGAKIIFLSPYTDTKNRGRFALQETSGNLFPRDLLVSPSVFDYAAVVESPVQLKVTLNRIHNLMQKPGGRVANICIPQDIQKAPASQPNWTPQAPACAPTCSREVIETVAQKLSGKKIVLWLGFGARESSGLVRAFAERTGSAVMSSPRGKGIFPESHPQYLGVTGFGGHADLFEKMDQFAPDIVLVLGSKLGEFTSSWNDRFFGGKDVIHVDIDEQVFGASFPQQHYFGVLSDIGGFLSDVLPQLPPRKPISFPPNEFDFVPGNRDRLCPGTLLKKIQRSLIEDAALPLFADGGNSMAWGTHLLRFDQPHFRISTGYGSMGHAASGVIGMALANEKRKAVALIGDGAMLMNGTEINTAVKYRIPAIWVVLNDGLYNMCRQGNALQGIKEIDCHIPLVDFAGFARSLGAEGLLVTDVKSLKAAISHAQTSPHPCVLDVRIDSNVLAPIGSRIKTLTKT